ncbi:gliding motility-associated C-terminal domain-containing protein [Pedobacter alpinus]|uniref:Gliding motility-associated C-terminal domain-containing protein n=1 Tax=Pedobacter alpinus TaxID=1590643 RepID=A0ABW5TN38_9SPHI
MFKKFLTLVCVLLSSIYVVAQVCNGSLGDPTVVINFGQGAGVGPPLSGVSTGYQFKNGDCPDDGFYSILNRTNNCFSNSWHTLTEDHTPDDTNGYMMVVNATNNSGIFYSFSVVNLCPKTNYEFSSFIINLIKPTAPCGFITKPNITFSVEKTDGTVIKTFDTGFINEGNNPEWKKYGFFFETPTGVSEVVLKMINNSGGGCGNDVAIDDITFRPCGPVILAGSSSNISSNTLRICENEDDIFSLSAVVSSGFSTPAYQWQINLNNGDGWNDIANSTNLNYAAEIKNANLNGYQFRLAVAERENMNSKSCRVFSEPITIETEPKFTVNAGTNLSVLENQSINLNAIAPTGLQYQWSPSVYLSNPNILNPIVKPLQSTNYTLTVTNLSTSCTAQDDVFVSVETVIKIPNTFTPNDDGVNDLWVIPTLIGNQQVDIKVFNRYGVIVYKSKGYQKAWDAKLNGKILPAGMYYYIIDTKAPTNNLYKGSVLIVK